VWVKQLSEDWQGTNLALRWPRWPKPEPSVDRSRTYHGSEEWVPAWAQEDRISGFAACADSAGHWIREAVIDAQVRRKRTSVNQFAPQPLVEEMVHVDRLPTVFHRDRPVVGCPHERFESGTITFEFRKRPSSRGCDSDKHKEQRPFASTVVPKKVGVGKAVYD